MTTIDGEASATKVVGTFGYLAPEYVNPVNLGYIEFLSGLDFLLPLSFDSFQIFA